MSGNPDPVDIHVGRRLRARRTLLGMSQGGLGEALGVTFQQVQKYERGANRMGSSRLYRISKVLDVPVSYFFEEMPTSIAGKNVSAAPAGLAEAIPDELLKRETLELVRSYYRIGDANVRKGILRLVLAVADN